MPDSDDNDNMVSSEKVVLVVQTMCRVCSFSIFLFFFLLQCNNPKTKEPKLTAAARIVPEWVEYDNEIKRLLRQVQEQDGTATQGQTPSPLQEKGS